MQLSPSAPNHGLVKGCSRITAFLFRALVPPEANIKRAARTPFRDTLAPSFERAAGLSLDREVLHA
jgi:hypothetical protein